ncbi:tail protein X [Laribacter hongkongensis]|uniref:tail protein X n=1 Tax=Laribacter hongkongensis TaxID=168471 RepID=UPI001EFE43E9|nr:tail protein X [Laribacter hongkongensis]MCG9100449.1 tail protein X [Laribacter hongkongensis]MCG9113316.1 tail protein X [Laribacter hongkongensis]
MRVIASQGDTVDLICQRHYGYTAGITEAVYAANPGLADLGPILPLGTPVTLPETVQPATPQSLINLWD